MTHPNQEPEQILTDEEMQQYLEDELSKAPSPLVSNEEAWQQIMKQANQQKSKKGNFIRKPLIAVASFLGLLIIFSIPTGGSAFFNITDLYYKIQGSVVNVFMGSSSTSQDQNTPSDDGIAFIEGGSQITIQEMTFHEAQLMTPFRLQQPTYVPDRFELQTTQVIMDYLEEVIEVILIYNESNGKEFTINQQSVSDQFGVGMVFGSNQTHEELEINGDKSLLITHPDHDLTHLIIMGQIIYFNIHGNLSREEILNMAKSMR